MKTSTKFAMAAAVTALMGTSAIAADLGGSCCADLEERIAELEATTVRKGNRKVSVQISGFVGHQIMWWDDGSQSDAYIGDGGNIFSRWRLRGSAKISPDLEAGFLYEFGVNNNSLASVNQSNGGDDLGESGPSNLRDQTVWLKHKSLGMVKIGHGSTSTDNLVLIDLANRSGAGTPDTPLYMGGFQLRAEDGLFLRGNWAQAIRGLESWDTTRRNHVLYETPSLAGFTVQAAIAEDNYWDVALRYAGEFNGVRVAFGIGYQEDSEFNRPTGSDSIPISGATGYGGFSVLCNSNCDSRTSEIKGSASILHVPTGLFMTGAAGSRELEGERTAGNALTQYTGPDTTFWHLSGGVAKNYFGIGNTVLFGEYSESEGGLEQADHVLNLAPRWTDTQTTQWGLGVNQYIDAAAMQIFATYKHFELEGNFNGLRENAEFSMFLVGTRIDF